jgi:hypothetical protein
VPVTGAGFVKFDVFLAFRARSMWRVGGQMSNDAEILGGERRPMLAGTGEETCREGVRERSFSDSVATGARTLAPVPSTHS